MLCCSFLLDMACHTTCYWHLFPPFPCRCSRLELRLRPRSDPKKGVKCWILPLLSLWTISRCSDLSWLQPKGLLNTFWTAHQSDLEVGKNKNIHIIEYYYYQEYIWPLKDALEKHNVNILHVKNVKKIHMNTIHSLTVINGTMLNMP